MSETETIIPSGFKEQANLANCLIKEAISVYLNQMENIPSEQQAALQNLINDLETARPIGFGKKEEVFFLSIAPNLPKKPGKGPFFSPPKSPYVFATEEKERPRLVFYVQEVEPGGIPLARERTPIPSGEMRPTELKIQINKVLLGKVSYYDPNGKLVEIGFWDKIKKEGKTFQKAEISFPSFT